MQRFWDTSHTHGIIYRGGQFVCHTIEPPTILGVKDYSAIARNKALMKSYDTYLSVPAGCYAVKMASSARFAYRNWYKQSLLVPKLENVPGYEGIEIHPGNSVRDTSGCILPGMTYNEGWMTRSVEAYLLICAIIREYPEGVELHIIDPQ